MESEAIIAAAARSERNRKKERKANRGRKQEVQTSASSPATSRLLPCRCGLLLQNSRGPIEVARGRGAQAPQLPDGLTDGAGVLGEALDVLEGQVDNLVAAGVTVQVSAGEALQPGIVGDAALAMRQVGPQR